MQRSIGSIKVVFSGSPEGTRVDDLFERSPSRLLFPRIDGRAVAEAVIANIAGGLAGGDHLETDGSMAVLLFQ